MRNWDIYDFKLESPTWKQPPQIESRAVGSKTGPLKSSAMGPPYPQALAIYKSKPIRIKPLNTTCNLNVRRIRDWYVECSISVFFLNVWKFHFWKDLNFKMDFLCLLFFIVLKVLKLSFFFFFYSHIVNVKASSLVFIEILCQEGQTRLERVSGDGLIFKNF